MSKAMSAFRNWLHQEEAKDAAFQVENAVGHVVALTDLEFGRVTLYGPYEDPVEAMRQADMFAADLNRFNAEGDYGWTATVYPLQPRVYGS